MSDQAGSETAKAANFDDVVAALIRQGHSEESARRIAASQCGKTAKRAVIVKVDNERRLVTAVTNVLTDDKGRALVDHDGDVIDIADLEDSFIAAFGKSGEGKSGVMHEVDGGADVAMAFTISRDEWAELLKGGYIGKDIGLVKIRVNDEATWQAVKDGRLAEVSIEGTGERVPV